jgi:branched-subunit amino acid transport protein
MNTVFPNAPAWWPYVAILLAGVLPTQIWRWLGVALAGHISPDSEVLVWVKAVATALVAAVVARLVIFPEGALAETPLWIRLGAALLGFVAFQLTRQNILVGVLVAETVLVGSQLLLFGTPF